MITSVTVAEKGDILVCANGGGHDMRFHAVWLRDNAPDCRHQVTPERPASDQHHRHPR